MKYPSLAQLKDICESRDAELIEKFVIAAKYSSSFWMEFIRYYWKGDTWAAENVKLPIDVLEFFVTHEDGNIRGEVTRHPNLPLRLIEKLCRDTDSTIRQNVACHSKITPVLLKKLSEDRVSWVREAACDVAHNREIDLSQIPSQKKKRWPNYHGNARTLGEVEKEKESLG